MFQFGDVMNRRNTKHDVIGALWQFNLVEVCDPVLELFEPLGLRQFLRLVNGAVCDVTPLVTLREPVRGQPPLEPAVATAQGKHTFDLPSTSKKPAKVAFKEI